MRRSKCLLLSGLVLASTTGSVLWANQQGQENHYSTPPGITLVDVVRKGAMVASGYLWTRIGDAEARTLFVYDGDKEPDVSSCNGECAREFPPAMAPENAQAGGDWSLVTRQNGDKQWAYQGKPLYRFSRETRFNEVVDNVVASMGQDSAQTDRTTLFDPDAVLMPPDGWHIARFGPSANETMPGGINIKQLPSTGGAGMVDARGMTLYVFDGDLEDNNCTDCKYSWRPLIAPQLSGDIGLFSKRALADGSRQWAYDDEPLFTYSGDRVPGDVNGVNHQLEDHNTGWRVAGFVRNFMPPGVQMRNDLAHGTIMSTTDGMPLYSRKIYRGADNLYRNQLIGCDKDCLKTWQPLAALPDARPRGYWEVVNTADGARVWAYKGFVQYTNRNDKPFKTITSHNVFDYTLGDNGRYKAADVRQFAVSGLSGLFWTVTAP